MMLKGIEFGNVWGASGVQGFFGEGYWYHRPLKPFGLDFDGATFVAKTTTLFQREGNMPRKKDLIRPKELFPKSIVVKPFKGVALNAVGLSGPGAYILFEKGFWQKREEPFFISFMSVENTPEKRIEELRRFVEFCRPRLPNFRAPVGLQINYSCPNVGLHLEGLVEEVQ